MKTRLLLMRVGALIYFSGWITAAFAQGTAFTYQGELLDSSVPANGSYDLKFALYTAAVGGSQQGPNLTNTGIAVNKGLFTITADFGPGIFTGSNYWLEIAARTNGNSAFITLSPRQPVTPSPYAIMANSASNLLGAVPSTGLLGAYPNPISLNNAGNSFSGNGAGLTGLNAAQLTTGSIADARLSGNVALRSGGNAFSGTNTFGSGSVGLGVVNPATRLHVSGNTLLQNFLGGTTNTTSNLLNLAIGTISNGVQNGISFYEVAGSPAMSLGYDGTVAGTGNNAVRIYNNTAAPIFSFLNGGSLGVGTTAPATLLHVKNGGDTQISIESSDVGSHRWTLQSSGITGQTNLDASFQVVDRSLSLSRLLIDTNGNMGVHNSSPSSTLDVNGTITASSLITTNQIMRRSGSTLTRIEPVAYGTVTSSGSAESGSGNFTASTSATGQYTITISNESYSFISYTTVVTPVGLSAVSAATFSSSGSLAVRLFSSPSGSAVNADFGFVVYKFGTN